MLNILKGGVQAAKKFIADDMQEKNRFEERKRSLALQNELNKTHYDILTN